MAITGIHHIALKCGSMELYEKTVGFYRDILGLPMLRQWGVGEDAAVMLDTGAGLLEIFAKAENTTSVGVVRHFAFATDDTAGMIEAVRAAGYPITVEPTHIAIPSTPPCPACIAFCIGPLGEEIEFFEEKVTPKS